jgi:hypothetical protein
MSNLGPQFSVKDWNPFAAASSTLSTINVLENVHHKRALTQLAAHYKNANIGQQSTTEQRPTPTPANTGAPTPGYLKRGPINPSTTGAPVPGTLTTKTSTNPMTGAASTPVPVKRKGAKPTAPGTRPKPPKKR